MRNLTKLLALPLLVAPVIPAASYACITSTICALRPRSESVHLAQYYPAQMMMGGGSPVIVPPTVINTQGHEHNSSKKSCKESVIDLFLFSVRRTTGDCTP